jgi:hypothetical protein
MRESTCCRPTGPKEFTTFTVLIVLITLPACHQSTVTRSQQSTTIQGREIAADIDGPAFISATENGAGAVISFAGRKIVVEQSGVLIDDVAKATIPADAKKVAIGSSKGIITVSVDGKQVYKSAERK